MKKILVGVDGSEESKQAIALASQIAQATGGKITLAQAIEPADIIWTAPELRPRASEEEAREREAAQLATRKLAEEIPLPIRESHTVLTGSPAVALANFAKEGHFDLVVVGHRGRNAVARVLLGSVADRLTQISSIPVLVAR